MRTRVFSPTHPTWALVGGDFKASRRNCISHLTRFPGCRRDAERKAHEMAVLVADLQKMRSVTARDAEEEAQMTRYGDIYTLSTKS